MIKFRDGRIALNELERQELMLLYKEGGQQAVRDEKNPNMFRVYGDDWQFLADVVGTTVDIFSECSNIKAILQKAGVRLTLNKEEIEEINEQFKKGAETIGIYCPDIFVSGEKLLGEVTMLNISTAQAIIPFIKLEDYNKEIDIQEFINKYS